MQHKTLLTIILLLLIISGCASKVEPPAPQGKIHYLSGGEINKLIKGKSIEIVASGRTDKIEFHRDGELTRYPEQDRIYGGWWKIDEEGRLCMRFRRWGDKTRRCYFIVESNGEFKQFTRKGMFINSFTVKGRIPSSPRARTAVRRTEQETRPENMTVSIKEEAPPQRSGATIERKQPSTSSPLNPLDNAATLRRIARDCPGCNLAGADLSSADLSNADLAGANLQAANLSSARLRKANLQGANLSSANLTDADLRGSTLKGANLYQADLTNANITGADLDGANLTEAKM